MINILHFSDFHYRSTNDEDYRMIVDKLALSISKQNIDFIVFSGDLLFEDGSSDDYQKAANLLFKPILRATGLSREKLLVVPGNHDLNRKGEMGMVQKYLSSLKSVKEVDEFCDDKQQLESSLQRFKNYNCFISDFYKGLSIDVSPLYLTGITSIKDCTIGFMGLNSAWRSIDSEKDRGNLLYPISFARKAIEKIKSCNLVICAMHHNVSDFKDFIEQDLDDLINENCHLLFTGHYHKPKITANASNNVGLIHFVAPATYNRYDNDSKYGYSLISIDEQTYDTTETTFYYIDGSFIKQGAKYISIPMSEEKKEYNDFRKIIRKRLAAAKLKADELFVYGKGKEDGQTFETLFKEPIIKDKSLQDIITTKHEGKRILLDEILKSQKSTIIFGHNKCGKTSLLYKLLIDSLTSYNELNLLPIYIDYHRCKSHNKWDIIKDIRDYYECNKAKALKLVGEHKILILIDDMDLNDISFIKSLEDQLKQSNNFEFIACSEETMSGQCALLNFEDREISKYYIHDITSREVHQLTYSWPQIPKERKHEIELKIVRIFTQMHIPFNYWTTSLFLWILEKTDEANIHNNFELINLYIDEILGKTDFLLNPNIVITYDDLKAFLGNLAEYLLKNGYEITEKELFHFTDDYRERNKKFAISAIEVINLLKDKNIIIDNEGKYTFRLKSEFSINL